MKKPDMACTTIRHPPLHVPDTGAHIRRGLSNMFDAPTIPEGAACSPLSANHLVFDTPPARLLEEPPSTLSEASLDRSWLLIRVCRYGLPRGQERREHVEVVAGSPLR